MMTMRISLAASLLFVLALTVASSRKPHKHHNKPNKRITYGYDTDIWDANYYVLFICGHALGGGTIVSPTRVITAAHAVHECTPDQVAMYMGVNSREDLNSATRYEADNFYMHPSYNPEEGFQHDIAVVYVRGEIQMNNNVGIIQVGTSTPPVGDFVMCLGYGGTQSGQLATRLQRSWFLIKSYDNNLMIVDAEKTSTMGGDSGGPCVFDNKLAGVIVGVVLVNDQPVTDIEVNVASEDIANFLRSHIS